jgi:pyruvate dehydrogenase E1 component
VGTVYDPFVCRGLDALIYALYNGARFVVVGTPSGVSLAPEGGAHQSTITPSIGIELPGLTLAEPAYATALDWLLCDGLARLARPDGDSLYLRLSTRPLDQAPFAAARGRLGDAALRADVLAGGYRLVEPAAADEPGAPGVVLAGAGAVMGEVAAAASELASEGVRVLALDLTSADRCYSEWRAELRTAAATGRHAALDDLHLARLLVGAERRWPIVTVHDSASHALAWLGSVFGARVVPVGVDAFGQSGSVEELYRLFDLLPEQIVNAALVAIAAA